MSKVGDKTLEEALANCRDAEEELDAAAVVYDRAYNNYIDIRDRHTAKETPCTTTNAKPADAQKS